MGAEVPLRVFGYFAPHGYSEKQWGNMQSISALIENRYTHISLVRENDTKSKVVIRSTTFCWLQVFLVVIPGVTIGASISKYGAAFLEEHDIFVPSDDDDD